MTPPQPPRTEAEEKPETRILWTDPSLDYLDLIADCLVALAWSTSPDAGLRRSLLEQLRRRGGRRG